jgi:hypothetical protein
MGRSALPVTELMNWSDPSFCSTNDDEVEFRRLFNGEVAGLGATPMHHDGGKERNPSIPPHIL